MSNPKEVDKFLKRKQQEIINKHLRTPDKVLEDVADTMDRLYRITGPPEWFESGGTQQEWTNKSIETLENYRSAADQLRTRSIKFITFHRLKTRSEYFKDVVAGVKKFEIRKNDRDFKVNDRIQLIEIDDHGNKTGQSSLVFDIAYILQGGVYGLDKDHVILNW